MKEYIAKEDFIKMWKQGLVAVPIHVDGSIDWDCIPTVTEAKICRKFLNKVAIKFPKTLLELWETVDLMLAEMEN